MKTLIYAVFMTLICSIYSCAPTEYLASEYGDEAEVTLKMNRALKGELLAVTDTMIYVLMKDKNILAVSNKNLKEIHFEKFAEHYSWITGVALYQVLPSVVVSILAASMDADFGLTFAISIIPAVVSTALFSSSSAKSTFDNLNEFSEILELKKFSRYPGGITERQLKNLLKYYGQDSCIYLK